MDYDLIVVKTLERVYKNYYYIIRGEHICITEQEHILQPIGQGIMMQ